MKCYNDKCGKNHKNECGDMFITVSKCPDYISDTPRTDKWLRACIQEHSMVICARAFERELREAEEKLCVEQKRIAELEAEVARLSTLNQPSGSGGTKGLIIMETPQLAAGSPARLCSPSQSVHFLSKTVEWATPQDFFDAANAEFGPFTVDVCATPTNAKCAVFFTGKDDGLSQEWAPSRCWMNPPYGREIGKWMRKAYEESKRGATVACLVPARTDTRWWHEYAVHGKIRFIRGRLKFGAGKANAPFPSALIVFSENPTVEGRPGSGGMK